MKAKDVLRMEWIGKEVKIVDSTNKHNIKIEGKVINETKNMFIIKTKQGEKKIMKSNNIFQIDYDNKKFNVKGDALLFSPEERIKVVK